MCRTTVVVAILLCALGSSVRAQTIEDARFNAFNRAANDKDDCSGYQAMADAALAGLPSGSLVHRVAATAAICAARDGRFDLTDRLVARFPTSAPGFRDFLVTTPYEFMIRRLVEVPGAGPSVFMAAKRWPEISQMRPPDNQGSELMAMAAFAAGKNLVGQQMLDDIGRSTALSIQLDRRFQPAWRDPAALDADLNLTPATPKIETGDAWRRRLIVLDRTPDEAAVLAAAHQAMLDDIADTDRPFGLAARHYGTDGDGQRAWIVARHIEEGRLDAASETLDLDHPGSWGARDFRMLDGVIRLASAFILADRADDARRLLDRWSRLDDQPPPEGVLIEYGTPKDADPTILPIKELKARLAGMAPTELEPGEWWLALACHDPEDRTATLLLAALKSPFYRSQALQALNLPPRHPPMGKADQDYRKRRDALLARSDVASAIEHTGRRLPPDLAWRLSRANLPF